MIVVERATEEDLEAVLNIAESGGVPARGNFLTTALTRREMVIAREGEKRVGFAIVNDGFFGQHFVWLLVVDSQHRGEGVASALFKYIEKTRPGDKLFTSTQESNADARAFLEKLGYERSGAIENLNDGDRELIYFKRLERR